MILGRNLNFIFYSLILLFSISAVSATCLNSPTYIEVISGSNSLGSMELNELNLKGAHIKSNLNEFPLKVRLKFENIESDCFESNEDVELRLFPNGISVPANSITTSQDLTIAEFSFNLNFVTPSSFASTYTIKNKNNPSGAQGTIRFLVDDEPPLFTALSYLPVDQIISPNTPIRIDYSVTDTGSGISSLLITGGISSAISFTNNQSYSGFIEKQLTSSQTYSFTLKDKLGNQKNEEVKFIVDSSGPKFTNLEIKGYNKDASNNRYVSFAVLVEDESYEFDQTTPDVYGDFSSINQNFAYTKGNCEKLENTKYTCSWENIAITQFIQTTTAPISFKSSDVVGNLGEGSFNKEIFYDGNGPNIESFYLENSIGQKNIFNTQDSSVIVKLEFSDESLENIFDLNKFSVIDEFDDSFFIIPQINFINKKAIFVWNVTDYIKKYSAIPKGNIIFKVTVYDTYANPTTREINISFNNNIPVIKDITFIENDYSADGSIKDGLITSGEKINFRIFVEDDNLQLDEDFIFANFYPISRKDNMRKVGASCSPFNDTTYQCDYSGIVVDNGHLITNIEFYAIDTAGNIQRVDYPVEIYAVGNEVASSFEINNMKIINILNRNLLKNPTGGVVDAWFKGGIDDIEGREGMIVVNYQLKSCNDSAMNPILLGDRNLFPNEVVYGDSGQEANRDFILKTEVKAHSNTQDLNEKAMDCTMSVLKRDNETVYPAELINFYLTYEFYDLPHDNLLNAQAQNILEIAEEIEWLGDWFDDVWDIYDTMSTVCDTVQTVRSAVGAIETIWNPVCMVLSNGPWSGVTGGPAKAIDELMKPIHEKTSMLAGGDIPVITTMCKFVTCDLGFNQKNFLKRAYDETFGEHGDLGAGSALCSISGVSQDEQGNNKIPPLKIGSTTEEIDKQAGGQAGKYVEPSSYDGTATEMVS